MKPEPSKEHEWLEKMIGEWRVESECGAGPDGEMIKMNGYDKVRAYGPLWVICDGTGDMPDGGTCGSTIILGFDPLQNRYVGSFVATVMSQLWIYNGTLDESGKVLTLDTRGPNFSAEGKMAEDGSMSAYQDIIEFHSDDHRTLRSRIKGEDGEWTYFMKADYYRVK